MPGSLGPLFGYSDFEYETRSEIVGKLFARWDTVFQNWLGGEYGKSVWLEDVLTADPEAQDLKDIHWCLYCHFTGDYDGVYYNWVEASDWLLEHSGLRRWPLSLRDYKRELELLTPVACPIPSALPVIPVLEPIRRVKRHNITPEEYDALPVGPSMPNLPVARRSTRVKKARDFYYF